MTLLKSEDISKLIGTRYEEKDTYEGKHKLIFMDGGKVADIYALRAQDSVIFIPREMQLGYAKVPRDTWFTISANKKSFVLKRYGISGNLTLNNDKGIAGNKPRFKIKNNNYVLCLSSDTLKKERECCDGVIEFDINPLIRKIAKEVFTKKQLLQIKQVDYMIFIHFCFYHDTGEIFECCISVKDRYKGLVSEEQWEQFSKIILNMRIDPQLITMLNTDFCLKGKRLFTGHSIYMPSSLTY